MSGTKNTTEPANVSSDARALSVLAAKQARGLLSALGSFAAEPYEEFLPKCLAHLKSLVRRFDRRYSDTHLKAVIENDCSLPTAGGFGSVEVCKEFADGLEAARMEELSSGSMAGYPPLCKEFYMRKFGSAAPKSMPKSTGAATPTPAAKSAPGHSVKKVDIGEGKCQCVGFSGTEGHVEMSLGKTSVTYPVNVGGRCRAWDKDAHPSCKADSPPKWCSQKWCYVNPCDCGLDVPPKVSSVQKVFFQGKPLYYSYATCGGVDSWTSEHHKEACVNQASEKACEKLDKCAWDGGKCLGKALGSCKRPLDPFKFGFKMCRCIGFQGVEGELAVRGGKMKMPADLGSTCKAWDEGTHPDCKGGGDKPGWCKQKWCYIDPCSCTLPDATPPALSLYIPGASFQNKPLYYSYATCKPGAEDKFAKDHHPQACVSQKSSSDCKALPKCAWKKERCVGKEFAGMC